MIGMMRHLLTAALLALPALTMAQNEGEDSSFQIAHVRTMQEVLVRADEPTWIRAKLKRFIAERAKSYQTEARFSEYHFRYRDMGSDLQRGDKRLITDFVTSNRFESQGLLLVPSMAQMRADSLFQIVPEQNIVYGTDTALASKPDSIYLSWQHFNDMLYGNLIQTLDSRFLRQHRFAVNEQFEHWNRNVVQLIYWSKKYELDRGYLNIDTARCVVLEAERHSGLECAKAEYGNRFALGLLHLLLKTELKDWTVNLRAAYDEDGQPREFRYQSCRHFTTWSDTKKKRREWIDSNSTVAATLTIRPTDRSADSDALIDIYPAKHVEIVNSKSRKYKMQQRLGTAPREYRLIR